MDGHGSFDPRVHTCGREIPISFKHVPVFIPVLILFSCFSPVPLLILLERTDRAAIGGRIGVQDPSSHGR